MISENAKRLVKIIRECGFRRDEFRISTSFDDDSSVWACFIGTTAIQRAAERIEELKTAGLTVHPIISQEKIVQIILSLPRSEK